MDDLIRARDDMLMRGWAMLCQVYADAHASDSPFESRCRGMRLLSPVLAAYVSLEDEVRRLAEEE